ncbi:PHP domain-containing protein [Methylocystis hirsuta]|uniref:PHP domain-containing protein n=1 Tax=Methylocystis hirsuta TaxID=369798 RepID=UPI001AECC632|nr:PHP domain-containing protein [Methylocystis hirsuta]
MDLRDVEEKSYGAALLYFTGSKAHNIALRNIAVDRGWKLNEYGLFSKTKSIAGATETDIYKKLGLQFMPPELREDRSEIALAQKNALPHLVQLADIRGDLHLHSNWSDGDAPIAEMARARGYEYMALTDHSRRVTVAHGLDRARLLRQIKEVDRLNAKMRGFTVLKGVEVDILADGELDLPDEVLSRLDLVVAAVHYKFDVSREKQTERIIRALDNRHVAILAHPTGRLIEEPPPYELDLERVMLAAKERGCALEINAEPDRQDLTDVAAKAAKGLGVRIAISTDARTPQPLSPACVSA